MSMTIDPLVWGKNSSSQQKAVALFSAQPICLPYGPIGFKFAMAAAKATIQYEVPSNCNGKFTIVLYFYQIGDAFAFIYPDLGNGTFDTPTVFSWPNDLDSFYDMGRLVNFLFKLKSSTIATGNAALSGAINAICLPIQLSEITGIPGAPITVVYGFENLAGYAVNLDQGIFAVPLFQGVTFQIVGNADMPFLQLSGSLPATSPSNNGNDTPTGLTYDFNSSVAYRMQLPITVTPQTVATGSTLTLSTGKLNVDGFNLMFDGVALFQSVVTAAGGNWARFKFWVDMYGLSGVIGSMEISNTVNFFGTAAVTNLSSQQAFPLSWSWPNQANEPVQEPVIAIAFRLQFTALSVPITIVSSSVNFTGSLTSANAKTQGIGLNPVVIAVSGAQPGNIITMSASANYEVIPNANTARVVSTHHRQFDPKYAKLYKAIRSNPVAFDLFYFFNTSTEELQSAYRLAALKQAVSDCDHDASMEVLQHLLSVLRNSDENTPLPHPEASMKSVLRKANKALGKGWDVVKTRAQPLVKELSQELMKRGKAELVSALTGTPVAASGNVFAATSSYPTPQLPSIPHYSLSASTYEVANITEPYAWNNYTSFSSMGYSYEAPQYFNYNRCTNPAACDGVCWSGVKYNKFSSLESSHDKCSGKCWDSENCYEPNLKKSKSYNYYASDHQVRDIGYDDGFLLMDDKAKEKGKDSKKIEMPLSDIVMFPTVFAVDAGNGTANLTTRDGQLCIVFCIYADGNDRGSKYEAFPDSTIRNNEEIRHAKVIGIRGNMATVQLTDEPIMGRSMELAQVMFTHRRKLSLHNVMFTGAISKMAPRTAIEPMHPSMMRVKKDGADRLGLLLAGNCARLPGIIHVASTVEAKDMMAKYYLVSGYNASDGDTLLVDGSDMLTHPLTLDINPNTLIVPPEISDTSFLDSISMSRYPNVELSGDIVRIPVCLLNLDTKIKLCLKGVFRSFLGTIYCSDGIGFKLYNKRRQQFINYDVPLWNIPIIPFDLTLAYRFVSPVPLTTENIKQLMIANQQQLPVVACVGYKESLDVDLGGLMLSDVAIYTTSGNNLYLYAHGVFYGVDHNITPLVTTYGRNMDATYICTDGRSGFYAMDESYVLTDEPQTQPPPAVRPKRQQQPQTQRPNNRGRGRGRGRRANRGISPYRPQVEQRPNQIQYRAQQSNQRPVRPRNAEPVAYDDATLKAYVVAERTRPADYGKMFAKHISGRELRGLSSFATFFRARFPINEPLTESYKNESLRQCYILFALKPALKGQFYDLVNALLVVETPETFNQKVNHTLATMRKTLKE